MKSLKELYQAHQGKVSDKWDLYLREYDRMFSPYRDKPVRMLEIGIQNGGSLEIWSQYFPNGQKFVGCDINPDCAKLEYDDPRITIIVGDANTDQSEADIVQATDCFDLIIDDGSHTSGDIVKSFRRYFPRLKAGGVFVAEDLHCSYWQGFEGGLYYPYSSISFFKRLADIVNHEHWGVPKTREHLLKGIGEHFSIQFPEELLTEIHSIEFVNSMCTIRKSSSELNQLGTRVIAGQEELVVTGHHQLDGKLSPLVSETGNAWTILDEAPDESFQSLSNRLQHSKTILAERDAQLAERDAQISGLNQAIHALYASTSWRVTQPLRFLGHQLARGKRIAKLAPEAIRIGGGVGNTFEKAWGLYRREGLAGIKRGLMIAQTSGAVKPSVGSGTFDRNDYTEWVRRYDTLDEAKRERIRLMVESFPIKPPISVVMPTYNPRPEWLIEAIESVRGQLYPHWELCIADDASPDKEVRKILERYERDDKRIKVVFREKNGHISAASNSALTLASGDWVALLDHDDILPEHALALVAQAIVANPDGGLIYSDEDKIDENGQRFSPHFKSDWNPELFRSQNMISHLGVYRRELIIKVGGFRVGFEGSQDHDLALRCSEHLDARQIVHIPHVLYHWRVHSESTASSGNIKTYAPEAGLKAVLEHLQRSGIAGDVELTPFFQYRVRYSVPDPAPRVTLIIPTRNGLHLIRQCVESIIEKTTYPNYEILIVDNGSDDKNTLTYFESLKAISTIRIMRDDREFNYSALNNAAVKFSSGELVALINNDIEVITPAWLDEMVGLAMQPHVGAVGAHLFYPDDTVQHAGVITGIGGIACHPHKNLKRYLPGYNYRVQAIQALSAVTGACLLVRKSTYLEVGGLNEDELKIAYNDVDFCLKVREAGYRNVWTPYAELYHHESATRGYEDTPEKMARFTRESNYMINRWGESLLWDPYYNQNLSLTHNDFSLGWPPRERPRNC
jgi:glycosyltransferase involved in cell wall biosynthesis